MWPHLAGGQSRGSHVLPLWPGLQGKSWIQSPPTTQWPWQAQQPLEETSNGIHYLQQNYDDFPEDEEHEGAYYEEDPNEEEHFHAAQEDDLPDMDDPEWEKCYATYLDARRRFAELKMNRSFYPVVARTDTNAAQGTGPQRPYPPKSKGKGAKGKKAAASMNTSPRTGTCLRCGQPGHYAAQCPQTAKRSPASTTTSSSKKTKSESP